jgi:hypothetical protein
MQRSKLSRDERACADDRRGAVADRSGNGGDAALGTKRHPEGYHHLGVPNPQHEGLWAQDHVTG